MHHFDEPKCESGDLGPRVPENGLTGAQTALQGSGVELMNGEITQENWANKAFEEKGEDQDLKHMHMSHFDDEKLENGKSSPRMARFDLCDEYEGHEKCKQASASKMDHSKEQDGLKETQGKRKDYTKASTVKLDELKRWCEEESVTSPKAKAKESEWNGYPWFAPRVTLQYLELIMCSGEPTTWTIDNYDGGTTWVELRTLPSEEYAKDAEPTPTQRREMRASLMQLEGVIEDIMSGTHSGIGGERVSDERQLSQWQQVKEDVRQVCMKIYEQAEWTQETLQEMRMLVKDTCQEANHEVHDHVKSTHEIGDHVENIRAIENHARNIHEECHDKETRMTPCLDKHLATFEKGSKTGRQQRRYEEESDDDADCEDDSKLVCNMIGQQWESLPFPVIVDSGACASVIPTDWCDHVPTTSTPQSKAGEFFRAANGRKIFNQGEKVISMMTKEGAMRDMKFAVCDVSKALGSVSQMCKTGHKVVFSPPWDPAGSYIQHIETGEKIWLEECNGLYILNTRVAPAHKQSINRAKQKHEQDFRRQVNP